MATLTTNYQKIATGSSQVFGSATGYLELYAKYNSQNITNNTTNYSVQLRLVVTGGYIGNYQATNYSLSSTGLTTSSGNSGSDSYTTRTITTITGNVTHNGDGKKSINSSGSINFTAWGQTLSVSGSATLPTIPRTSGVASSSPFIGDVATITIDRKSTSFTDTLRYTIGELTGLIREKTKDTVVQLDTSTIADEIYALIPNSKEIEGKIICETYSGNTKIGTSEAKFNLYAKENVAKPTVSGTIVDTNERTIALTGSANKFIKYVSQPKVTVNATANKSATIKSYSINLNDGQTQNVQEYTFPKISSNKVTVNAIDRRGYGNPQDIDLTDKMIDYVELHIDKISIKRTEEASNEIIMNLNGVWYNGDFSSTKSNTLNASYQYKSTEDQGWTEGGTLLPVIDGNTFKITNLSLGTEFDYQKEYQFQVYFTDELMTIGGNVADVIVVPKGQEVVAIGEDGVWVYGDLFLNDEKVSTLDKIYPIGSIYMNMEEIDPSELFGGEWEQLKDTFLLSAGDTYEAGSTGGEAEHTLTVAEIPDHKHSIPNYNGSGVNGFGVNYGTKNYAGNFYTTGQGGGQPHNNMPPYLTVYMWKRIA